MKIFILLISLIQIIFAEEIYINDNSILSLSYYNNQKYPISIAINNNKFRESSLLPNNKGIFSIYLKPGLYNISSNLINLKKHIETGKIIKSNSKLDDKILKINKWTIIEKINYYNNKDHNIKLSSMINLGKLNNFNGNYLITILLNGNLIDASFLNNSVYTFISNVIKVPKGNNTIILKGTSFKNVWCSCPTAYDGFYFGRHLTVWILDNNDQKKISYFKNKKMNENVIQVSNLIPITVKINNNKQINSHILSLLY